MNDENPQNPFIRLDDRDNVVVARMPVPAGTPVPMENAVTRQDVPSGHKVAARFIAKGEAVRKYDTVIGYAAEDLPPGTWMHSHNILFDEVEKDYAFSRDYRPTAFVPAAQRATFRGIRRADGRVGTRNHVGVLVLGNTGGTAARRIADHFTPDRLAGFPRWTASRPYVHELGEGMERSGEPMALLRRTLAGYVRHPNTAASLIVAAGARATTWQSFLMRAGLVPGPLLRTLVMRDLGGTRRTIEAGHRRWCKEMLPRPTRSSARDGPRRAHHHRPAVRRLGRLLRPLGQPRARRGDGHPRAPRRHRHPVARRREIYGVEHTLTARAVTPRGRPEAGGPDQLVADATTRAATRQINGRVSPGNNAGGLANVLEKSLGGAKKGGTSPLMEVYRYAEPVTQHGLVFMDTPGYDPVLGHRPDRGRREPDRVHHRPRLLLRLAAGADDQAGHQHADVQRMADDMDINCGVIIDGDATLAEMGQRIFEQLLRHASGEPTKSELSGMGRNEFVPWPIGVLA